MNLTIGTTTIKITSCTRKRDTQRGFYLDLTIPKDNIGMDDLYALLNGNTEPIVVIEADGTENTYIGFKETGSFALEGGFYKVAQVCTSEYEAQLSLAQSKMAEQDAIIAAQNETIEAQTEEIIMLNDTLLELLMA